MRKSSRQKYFIIYVDILAFEKIRFTFRNFDTFSKLKAENTKSKFLKITLYNSSRQNKKNQAKKYRKFPDQRPNFAR